MDRSEWVLVPRVATDEMEAAAEDRYEGSGTPFPKWKSAYHAMLAAAPPPPAEQASGEWESLRQWWWQRTEHMEPGAAEMVRELLRSIAALSQRPVAGKLTMAEAYTRGMTLQEMRGWNRAVDALAPQQPEKGEAP